jgi:hypothetical protein
MCGLCRSAVVRDLALNELSCPLQVATAAAEGLGPPTAPHPLGRKTASCQTLQPRLPSGSTSAKWCFLTGCPKPSRHQFEQSSTRAALLCSILLGTSRETPIGQMLHS